MMRLNTLGALLFLTLACSGPLHADGASKTDQDTGKATQTTKTKPDVVKSTIDPDKERAIRKLMDLTGAGKLGAQVGQQMIDSLRTSQPSVPDEFWTEFAKKFQTDDLVNLIVPIYDKHFSKEDIDGLIAFYESPLGQKVTATLPAIMSESMQVGQQWGEAKGREIVQELQKRYGQQNKAGQKPSPSKSSGKTPAKPKKQ